MSKPTKGDWLKLKRLGRYLVGRPRLQQVYPWQSPQNILKVFTDADRAGCKESRRSTTGGCAMLGRHTLKGWSKTQTLIALSSGESDLYAALKASAEAFGMVALPKDLGYEVKGEIWGDASAALGIINRKGLGKTRHIDTSLVWLCCHYHVLIASFGPQDNEPPRIHISNHHIRNLLIIELGSPGSRVIIFTPMIEAFSNRFPGGTDILFPISHLFRLFRLFQIFHLFPIFHPFQIFQHL